MGSFSQKIKAAYLRKREAANQKRLERCIIKLNKSKNRNIRYQELLQEMSSEEWQDNKIREKEIKSKAYYCILCGIICILISVILNIYCERTTVDGVKKMVIQSFLNVLNTVCSMLIGIGAGTLVLDFFSYVQYTKERLKEVIIEKDFIKRLSDDEKKNLIFRTEESLYFKDGKVLPNSLYADVKKKITPLLSSCYFSECNISISCEVDESKKVIRKEILKSMKIISNEDNETFQLPFVVYMRCADGEEKEPPYEILSCFFQDEEITDKFKEGQKREFIKEQDGEVAPDGNVQYKQDYKFKLKRGENRIELRMKTTVPIDDPVYMHTLTLPCMRYNAVYDVCARGYSVDGYGFALENKKETPRKNVSYSRIGHSLTINMDKWVLPGEGVLFLLKKC